MWGISKDIPKAGWGVHMASHGWEMGPGQQGVGHAPLCPRGTPRCSWPQGEAPLPPCPPCGAPGLPHAHSQHPAWAFKPWELGQEQRRGPTWARDTSGVKMTVAVVCPDRADRPRMLTLKQERLTGRMRRLGPAPRQAHLPALGLPASRSEK